MNSKLSKEIIDFLAEAVSYGLSKQRAAQKAGVSRHTLSLWLKAGKDIHEGDDVADTEYKQLCVYLYVQLKQKKAEAISQQLEYMNSLSKGVEKVSIKEVRDPQGDILQTITTITKEGHYFPAVKWLIEKLDPSYRDDHVLDNDNEKQDVTLKDVFTLMKESLEE